MLDINLPYHQLLPHLGGVKCVLDCSETEAVWHGDERQNLLIRHKILKNHPSHMIRHPSKNTMQTMMTVY